MKTNDEIYSVTRGVAVMVVPFLWLAFLILFFIPDSTGERFAWAIKPHMTALYMGAGYLGGSWLFINAIFGKRWHSIQNGFLPVTAFTWFMIFATFLHWDRFSHGNLGFTLWLILYLVTPFLVPVLWYYNRKTDSGKPEERDWIVPPVIRFILKLLGAALVMFALVGMFFPTLVIAAWPWTLTALTARVMSGWGALLGVGSLTMSGESRWSGWKIPMECIFIWHVLVLVAAAMNPLDFKTGILNWYTFSVAVMVTGIFVFYLKMEVQRRRLEKN